MPVRRAVLVVVCTALMVLSGTAVRGTPAAPPTPAPSPGVAATDLTARLDTAVQQVMRELGIPGAIVGVSVPGVVDHTRAYGTGDKAVGTPMSVDDHMRIGSVTKTFTGTAVLQLVEQGRIALTDPIGKYVAGVPAGDDITLRMLRDMHSGLYSFEQDPEFVTTVLDELPKGPAAGAVTPQRLLEITARHPLNFAPGSRFQYANVNLVLLGMVVEKVTGQSLAEYFQQHIFDPLRLTRTSYPADGQLPAPYAHGYTLAPDGKETDASLWNPAWAGAAGAMVSTVADLKTWVLALAKGTLLDPQLQRERMAQVDRTGLGALYRFAVFDVNGWWGHNGSIPGYTTVAVAIPERNATLVVLADTDIPAQHAAGRIAEVVTQLVTPDNVYTLAAPAPAPTPTPTGR
ncbi:serine hydrolase domain-containing protein [Catellatospora citrea]|uniref:Serine hydrolase n=1 Tax=Catellatospora citrea TaxID=53366 RepID=A0A8J3NYQ0_9ACTN|nr:serine hydrolase domain-containing protein [Catellatospora citrea]GIF95570.1 serine hydrolase [Catellatospora citrea]